MIVTIIQRKRTSAEAEEKMGSAAFLEPHLPKAFYTIP